jgi:hypothetical protein
MHIRNLFLRVFPDACGAYANSPILAANHLELYAKEGRYGPGRIQAVEPSSLVVRGHPHHFFCLSTGGIILDTGQTYPNGFYDSVVLTESGL